MAVDGRRGDVGIQQEPFRILRKEQGREEARAYFVGVDLGQAKDYTAIGLLAAQPRRNGRLLSLESVRSVASAMRIPPDDGEHVLSATAARAVGVPVWHVASWIKT